jgi:hypothetical protein
MGWGWGVALWSFGNANPKSLLEVLYLQRQHGQNQRSLTALTFIMPANIVIDR